MKIFLHLIAVCLIGFEISFQAVAGDATALPEGHAVIRAPAGDSEIVITSTSRSKA